jgi:hypothetical protein
MFLPLLVISLLFASSSFANTMVCDSRSLFSGTVIGDLSSSLRFNDGTIQVRIIVQELRDPEKVLMSLLGRGIRVTNREGHVIYAQVYEAQLKEALLLDPFNGISEVTAARNPHYISKDHRTMIADFINAARTWDGRYIARAVVAKNADPEVVADALGLLGVEVVGSIQQRHEPGEITALEYFKIHVWEYQVEKLAEIPGIIIVLPTPVHH